VTTHAVVRSSGEYRYQLIDASGRLLAKGFIRQGNTEVVIKMVNTGVAFLKVFDGREQFHFKIIKK
jgi:hypothetical protein